MDVCCLAVVKLRGPRRKSHKNDIRKSFPRVDADKTHKTMSLVSLAGNSSAFMCCQLMCSDLFTKDNVNTKNQFVACTCTLERLGSFQPKTNLIC